MNEKPEYWYKQSSVIPFKSNNEKLELLIIRSRKDKKWIFPKGIIEPTLTSQESAKKEAEEEAGVKGVIKDKYLGIYSYKKWGGKCKVKVYALEVKEILDIWEESFRLRRWINIDEVNKYISSKKIIKIISAFEERFHNSGKY